LPATFKGRKAKQNKGPSSVNSNGHIRSGSKTTAVRKKRVDAMSGDDIGALPIKRKKAPLVEVPVTLDDAEE
jgi:hypothetical protein